jgi:hypothetical protein
MKRDTIGKQNKADEQPPGSTTPHPHSARPYYIRAPHAPLYSRGGSGAELGGDPCARPSGGSCRFGARPSGGSSLVGLVLARPGAHPPPMPLSVWCSPVLGARWTLVLARPGGPSLVGLVVVFLPPPSPLLYYLARYARI